ncbi:hypothetical protein EMIT07CA2_70148 [Brevibacillus sp. IT-7CA2]
MKRVKFELPGNRDSNEHKQQDRNGLSHKMLPALPHMKLFKKLLTFIS